MMGVLNCNQFSLLIIMIKISISVSAHRFMVDGVFLMFVMHRELALVKCSLNLFSHLASCHSRRPIKVSLTALRLCWVLVLESRETGGCALAVQSQQASENFFPSQTLPHAGLRGGSKCLTPVPGAGCLLQTHVHGAGGTSIFSKKRFGTKQALWEKFLLPNSPVR